MKKEIIAGLVIAVVCITTGYFALGAHKTSQTQSQLNDFSDSANLQSCKDIRRSICTSRGETAEADYPDSCFNNGENILENPYQCPN